MNAHITIIVKALEDGVTVLFSVEGQNEIPPPERLDKGEVLVLPSAERHNGVRVRGRAMVYSPDHVVEAESGLVIGGRG